MTTPRKYRSHAFIWTVYSIIFNFVLNFVWMIILNNSIIIQINPQCKILSGSRSIFSGPWDLLSILFAKSKLASCRQHNKLPKGGCIHLQLKLDFNLRIVEIRDLYAWYPKDDSIWIVAVGDMDEGCTLKCMFTTNLPKRLVFFTMIDRSNGDSWRYDWQHSQLFS